MVSVRCELNFDRFRLEIGDPDRPRPLNDSREFIHVANDKQTTEIGSFIIKADFEDLASFSMACMNVYTG
jgi:hypothetical protein